MLTSWTWPPGHINIGRNAAPQIQQRVQFHGALAAVKFSPREKRQTQIDGREVEGIHGLGQFHSQRFSTVKVASGGHQDLGEIGVDPPVAMFVGVCQGVARNLAPEAHMIELRLLSTKTSFDIAEAFAISELSKGQTEEWSCAPCRRWCERRGGFLAILRTAMPSVSWAPARLQFQHRCTSAHRYARLRLPHMFHYLHSLSNPSA